MIKNCLFALALLSLALAGGCAKGGNGIFPTVTVNTPTGISPDAIYPTQSVTFTATTTDPAGGAVTWSLSGTACTGTQLQYASRDACMALCPTFPVGTLSDITGNTLGCRLKLANTIATSPPPRQRRP